MFSFKIVNWMW